MEELSSKGYWYLLSDCKQETKLFIVSGEHCKSYVSNDDLKVIGRILAPTTSKDGGESDSDESEDE